MSTFLTFKCKLNLHFLLGFVILFFLLNQLYSQKTDYSNHKFVVVENMAIYGECENYETEILRRECSIDNIYAYIKNNLKSHIGYNQELLDCKIIVTFVIDSLGNLVDERIIKGCDSILDESVLQVVRGMQNWTPATSQGKKIPMVLNIPISLNNEDEE